MGDSRETFGPNAFVTGYPIKHSRSPLIHGHWLRTLDLVGSYRAHEVSPDDFSGLHRLLEGRLERLRRRQCDDPAQGDGIQAGGSTG